MFRHNNIRLPLDRYVGAAWFFSHALSHAVAIHAYCIMPDHVHLLSEGLTPTANLLEFLKDLKRETGFAYKQETKSQLWQKKSYDRALRSTARQIK